MPPHWKHRKGHRRMGDGDRLSDVPPGRKYNIISVGTNYGSKRRLAHLGIFPGVVIIKKRSAPMRGPVEIIVKGTSLVIGRGLASQIVVGTTD